MLFLKHPAWLWIKKNAKNLMPPIDEALQARFDDGNAFEPFVEGLFQNLVRLGFDSYSDILICLKNNGSLEERAEACPKAVMKLGQSLAFLICGDEGAYINRNKSSTTDKKNMR